MEVEASETWATSNFPLRFSDGTISLRIFRESHRVSEESLKIFAMKEIAKGNEESAMVEEGGNVDSGRVVSRDGVAQ